MAEIDALTKLEALETLLIERKWLSLGEVDQRAQQILNHRAALDLPLPGENTEG